MGQPLLPHQLPSSVSAKAVVSRLLPAPTSWCCVVLNGNGDMLSAHAPQDRQVPCRCAIQLTVLGYILEPIFAFDAWWLVVIICICMLLISAAEAVSHPTAAYQVTAPDACWVHVHSEICCSSAVNGMLLCTRQQAAFVAWGCNCSGA